MGAYLILTAQENEAIANGLYPDPFSLLGIHKSEAGYIARTLILGADEVAGFTINGEFIGNLEKIHPNGVFEGLVNIKEPQPITYRAKTGEVEWLVTCPYSFTPIFGSIDDYLINEGTHTRLFDLMGAHKRKHQETDGISFAVWAPNAKFVSVVGDFNNWDRRIHIMRRRFDTGIFEIFIPHIGTDRLYKFHIIGHDGQSLPLKADPFAFKSQLRPENASITSDNLKIKWEDADHKKYWQQNNLRNKAVSIYEVHAGSWQRTYEGDFLNWDQLSDTLIPYVVELGFTHIEFLPISEHPLDESWGYQTIGLYSPSARFGDKEGFARFVNNAHKAGISIILDWVPAHFPSDEHGLALFDGTPLYEYEDPRLGFHPEWTTYVYNFAKKEVISYLVNNAIYWLENFHVDGLRVDAVASMLYRDYARKNGEWIPNNDGGKENWEAVNFLKRVNHEISKIPGAYTIAEESTSWPKVSGTIAEGGLGFNFKWNMGFMNDTLRYMKRDPIHRKYHHNEITFGIAYAFSENFVLPLSHDEVVHEKGTLLTKMSGDDWQKFANLRAYYGFMWGHPGKKLLFMGQEFAQRREWCELRALDWFLLDAPMHKGVQNLIKDLNHLYKTKPQLHERDCDSDGFQWLIVDDKDNSVFAWLRFAENHNPIAVICNFSGTTLHNYRVPLSHNGDWKEILNTDSHFYGGSGTGNFGKITCNNNEAFLTIPALSTLIIEL